MSEIDREFALKAVKFVRKLAIEGLPPEAFDNFQEGINILESTCQDRIIAELEKDIAKLRSSILHEDKK